MDCVLDPPMYSLILGGATNLHSVINNPASTIDLPVNSKTGQPLKYGTGSKQFVRKTTDKKYLFRWFK